MNPLPIITLAPDAVLNIGFNEVPIEDQLAAARARVEQLKALVAAQIEAADLERRLFISSSHNPASIIGRTVADFYGVPLVILKSKARPAKVATTRMVIFFLLRKLTHLRLEDIGALFARDFDTVRYGVGVIAERLTVEPRFAADLAQLETLCRKALPA